MSALYYIEDSIPPNGISRNLSVSITQNVLNDIKYL